MRQDNDGYAGAPQCVGPGGESGARCQCGEINECVLARLEMLGDGNVAAFGLSEDDRC